MVLLALILGVIYGISLRLQHGRRRKLRSYQTELKCVTAFYALFYVAITFLTRPYSPDRVIVLIPFEAFIERIRFCITWGVYLHKAIPIVLEVPLISGFLRGSTTPMEGMLLNILLFVPAGALFVSYRRDKAKIIHAVIFGLLISLATELLQLATGLGWFDVNDIIANTIGSFIGAFWIYKRIHC